MSAREPEPCEGLTGVHEGPVRFYRVGWRCNAHSPWAEAGQDEPQPVTVMQWKPVKAAEVNG